MKKLAVVIGICMMYCNTGKSQIMDTIPAPVKNKANNAALGYHVNEFDNHFGLGINVTSSYFAFKVLALRASENYQRFNYIDTTAGKYTWAGYHNIKIGILSSTFILNKGMRLYGEGGVGFLICPDVITSTKNSYAGYGLFGFEFFISKGFSYFIELGAIGTKTTADNLPNSPIFSNGFTTSGGLRLYLN